MVALSVTGSPIVPSSVSLPSSARRKFCCRRPGRSRLAPARSGCARSAARRDPRGGCQPSSQVVVVVGVGEGLGHVDVDPAEGRRHVAEALEVDHRQVVDPQSGEVLDGAQGAERAIDGERGVDLVLAVHGALGVVDRHVGVARDRHHRGALPVGRDVQDDDRVAAIGARVPGAVGEHLGDGGLVLLRVRVVRAQEQDVERRWAPARRPLALLQRALSSMRGILSSVLFRLQPYAAPAPTTPSRSAGMRAGPAAVAAQPRHHGAPTSVTRGARLRRTPRGGGRAASATRRRPPAATTSSDPAGQATVACVVPSPRSCVNRSLVTIVPDVR